VQNCIHNVEFVTDKLEQDLATTRIENPVDCKEPTTKTSELKTDTFQKEEGMFFNTDLNEYTESK